MPETNPPSGMPLPQAMAGNFQDAVRWFNQMWSTGADPAAAARTAAGAMPSMMMPTLDVRELDKRLADLRSVEQWLQLNVSLLRTTIQALEMQRSGLMAWQSLGKTASGQSGASKPEAGASAPDMSAFQPAVWWAALQQQFAQMAANATAPDKAPSDSGQPAAAAAASSNPKPGKPAKSSDPGPTPP